MPIAQQPVQNYQIDTPRYQMFNGGEPWTDSVLKR
jgi:hypothetical protein